MMGIYTWSHGTSAGRTGDRLLKSYQSYPGSMDYRTLLSGSLFIAPKSGDPGCPWYHCTIALPGIHDYVVMVQ